VIDKYLNRQYKERTYNCAHLVCEVWAELKNPQIAEILAGFLCAAYERRVSFSLRRTVTLLDKPIDPCVIWLQANKTPAHVGIWWHGKVLHITRQGVFYQPLEIVRLGFKRVRFFVC